MHNNNNNSDENLFSPVINNIKNKKYNEALGVLEKITTINKDLDTIYKLKAFIYLQIKDWKNSLHFYQKISQDKINFEIYNNMGVALYKLGKFSKASIKFKESIKNKNSYIPAYENFCVTNKLLGNYNSSVEYSLEALKLVPTNNKIKNNLVDIFNYYEPKKNENSI